VRSKTLEVGRGQPSLMLGNGQPLVGASLRYGFHKSTPNSRLVPQCQGEEEVVVGGGGGGGGGGRRRSKSSLICDYGGRQTSVSQYESPANQWEPVWEGGKPV